MRDVERVEWLEVVLDDCRLQLEYLNEKFGATGTTNALLAKIGSYRKKSNVVDNPDEAKFKQCVAEGIKKLRTKHALQNKIEKSK